MGGKPPCLSWPAGFQSAVQTSRLTSCWWGRPHCHSEPQGLFSLMYHSLGTTVYEAHSCILFMRSFSLRMLPRYIHRLIMSTLPCTWLWTTYQCGGVWIHLRDKPKTWDICFPTCCGWPKCITAVHKKSAGVKIKRLRFEDYTYQYWLREHDPLRPICKLRGWSLSTIINFISLVRCTKEIWLYMPWIFQTCPLLNLSVSFSDLLLTSNPVTAFVFIHSQNDVSLSLIFPNMRIQYTFSKFVFMKTLLSLKWCELSPMNSRLSKKYYKTLLPF